MRIKVSCSSRRAIAAITLAAVAAATLATPALASGRGHSSDPLVVDHPAPASPEGHGTPPDDRPHGMVYAGLAGGHAACPHELAVVGVSVPMCSHGPDEPPAGVVVQERPSTATLNASVTDGSASTAGVVPCYGDGVTGQRIQAVYAHAADVADRYADVVGLIGQWAAGIDNIYRDSAAETGGVRHLRWVTDASCNLSVLDVQLSNTGDDDLSATINELSSLGLNKTNRHYIVWTDAITYCGIGTFVDDDRAGTNNGNNSGPAYARVDSGCWGQTNAVEAHEIMHGLGGVQYSAPHTSGGGHCTDDYDRMCYADGSGVTMTYTCPSSHERLFDCGHDDYFHTAPPNGSYLAGHWNAASSLFLESSDPSSPSTTSSSSTSTTAAPTTTTTAAPSTTVTDSWSGSLSRKATTKSYAFSAGAGSVAMRLSFSNASSLSMKLTAADGSVLAQGSGPSVLTSSSSVTAGTYTVTVSASGASAKFTLSVTHQS